MHSFKQEFLPVSFNATWQTNRIRRNEQAEIELRNDDLFAIPFARTKFCERLPLTSFPKTWTDFPSEEIKFIRNKIEFNEKLNTYFLDQLGFVPNCVRLLCPACHL